MTKNCCNTVWIEIYLSVLSKHVKSYCVPVSDGVIDAPGVVDARVRRGLRVEVDLGVPRLLPRYPRGGVTVHGRASDLKKKEKCSIK